METYQRYPITIEKGDGIWLWDNKGTKYLDAVAGIATCSLGHSNKALSQALKKQLKKIQHISNLYHIPEQEDLAQWLVSNSCADKVFFCNSGAEANEAAIKLARKYGHIKRNIDRPIILTANSSFHGRTLAALSATGQEKYHKGFEPLVEGFKFFDFNDSKSFQELFQNFERNSPQISAVLLETIQGEGGVNPAKKDFLQTIRQLCTEKKVLLIFDEVQTGMGRTGTLWGYEQYDIQPDVFTIAKGLGGGHAIGALLVKGQANVFQPGDHASTFGGNPFACKAALTVGQEIHKRNLLLNVSERGQQLKKSLSLIVHHYSSILNQTRGVGLIQSLVIRDDVKITSQEIVKAAIEKNLLLVSAGNKVVRMVPALTISKKGIDELIKRLRASLDCFV